MTSTTLLPPRTGSPAATLAAAVESAARRVTWRAAGLALLIAAAMQVVSVWGLAFGNESSVFTAADFLSAAIVNLVMAYCLMFAAFVADHWGDRDGPVWLGYGTVVVAGVAAGTLLQWAAHVALGVPAGMMGYGPDSRRGVDVAIPLFAEYLTWGAVGVFLYARLRSAQRARARMSAAFVQRSVTQRRMLESRLQALQARVEPQFLFDTLAQVRDRYDADPAGGGRLLGSLILYLRAALPHLRDTTSTLGRELELVTAYLDIVRTHLGREVALRVDVPAVSRDVRMPPMVLLPLMHHVLARDEPTEGDPRVIRIGARSVGAALRIEFDDNGPGFAQAAVKSDLFLLEERLRALYGPEGTLGFEAAERSGTRAIVLIPHEPGDGGHR